MVLWPLMSVALIFAPSVAYLLLDRASCWETSVSIVLGLVGTTCIFACLGISRVKPIVNSLGIEIVIRAHRLFALVGAGFIVAHVAWAIFIRVNTLSEFWNRLVHSSHAQQTGGIATLAVLAAVASALTVRYRNPRYEGWRLWHVLLSWVIVVFAVLHILFLDLLSGQKELRIVLAVYLLAMIVLILYRWLYRPLKAHHYPYVIDEVREESPSVLTLVMHAKGHSGTKFKTGQFAWIKIGDSAFVFEEHPFTVSSSSTDAEKKEITIKALGDFSEIVSGIRPGRTVYLDGPYGRFTLDKIHKSEGFVFIAGGVGITPMISMIRTLAEHVDTRPSLLIMSARTENELLFRDELALFENLRVVEVLRMAQPGWDGETGVISRELIKRHLRSEPLRRLDYFICGAPLMVESVVKILHEFGVPNKRVHTETFIL